MSARARPPLSTRPMALSSLSSSMNSPRSVSSSMLGFLGRFADGGQRRARGAHVAGQAQVDERRLARGDCRVQRDANLLGALGLEGRKAKGLGQLGEVGVEQVAA